MIPARISVLGGSTVHGQGDPLGGGFVSRLKSWHECPDPVRNRVFNLGIGGDRVGMMLNRGPAEVAARRTDLTILYPGLNDTQRVGGFDAPLASEPKVVREALVTLIERIRERSRVLVMSSVPHDESKTTPFRGNVFFMRTDAVAMNALVADVAQYMGIEYFDLFERWHTRGNVSALLADGLHCNAAGHQLLFEELRAFLESTFNEAVN